MQPLGCAMSAGLGRNGLAKGFNVVLFCGTTYLSVGLTGAFTASVVTAELSSSSDEVPAKSTCPVLSISDEVSAGDG